MMETGVPIYADDGTLFCKCYKQANGEIRLEGAKGKAINLLSLQEQVFNPQKTMQNRGKRTKR